MSAKSIVRHYLEQYRELLLQRFRLTDAAGSHGGDLGENREQLIVDFINDIQPRRLFARRGGQVLGLHSEPSKQVDVLVTHDSTIEFRKDGKSYRLTESVIAGVAVKSDLTKDRLKDDFANLASIPKLSHDVLKLSHLEHERLFEIYTRAFPVRMVVGWNGATAATLLEGLNEIAESDTTTPVEAYPDVVTVLKRGFSIQLVGKAEFLRGRTTRDHVRWEVVGEEHGAAWPLAWLLNQLSAGSGWSGMITVDIVPYW